MGPLRHSRSPEDRSCFVQMKIACTVNINAEAIFHEPDEMCK